MSRINNSDFVNIMFERGFIHQITDKENLEKEMQDSPIVGYIGFDCTAPSLHVGSLIQIMMLRWFQKTGNKPIVLMGGRKFIINIYIKFDIKVLCFRV